jgi:hypothetical protein
MSGIISNNLDRDSGLIKAAAVAFDGTDVRNDLLGIALKNAITENRAAYNLPNTHIQIFQDDTAIDVETNGDRNASEYWSVTGGSATGTLASSAQTANAAQTKVSGLIVYANTEGTATLGTDIRVYFTCNGSTYTESTLSAAGTFASGFLMAKAAQTTCTSGTDVRYKVVWANQSAGSKTTRLHGVGMNF